MAITETSSQSWLSRLGNSIKGVLFGLLLFFGAFVLLWWNEGRAVRMTKALQEGERNVVLLDAAKINKDNDGSLVHFQGKLTTQEFLKDEQFGINENVLRLKRTVEMYQWEEDTDTKEKKKIGGGKETKTTYTYKKVWSSDRIDSEKFKDNEKVNPAAFPMNSYERSASKMTIGDYDYPQDLYYKLYEYSPYELSSLDSLPVEGGAYVYVDDQKVFYFGEGSSSQPQIGDARVKFSIVPTGNYSIVAKQNQNSLVPYTAKNGNTFALVAKGSKTAEEMFAKEHRDNRILTWILRFGGYFLMAIGLILIVKPLVVVADVVPFIGNMLQNGAAFVAFVISFFLTMITIAAAWLFYRPLLALALFSIGVAVFVFFYTRARKKKQETLV